MSRMIAAALALVGLSGLASPFPAFAQFYKDKTLNLLVNYTPGGNADLEARLFQQFLGKYIPGRPNIVVQNAPGAGGINGMNMLGLNIGSKADGLTLGYFTFGPISTIGEDPALKINVADFVVVGAARSYALAYGRKDIPPGLRNPADFLKAKNVFIGGYARSSVHDTRLRFALELLNIPYKMITGLVSVSAVNKSMAQNEINFSGTTLPAWQTQAVPQLINTGIAMPIFQFDFVGRDGKPSGYAPMSAQGVPTFSELYQAGFGKPPSGPKWEALLLANHLGTQMSRLIVFPKGSPTEARDALREAFQAASRDPEFIAAYERTTGEKPDIAPAEDVEPLLARIRAVDPEIKKVVVESIAE